MGVMQNLIYITIKLLHFAKKHIHHPIFKGWSPASNRAYSIFLTSNGLLCGFELSATCYACCSSDMILLIQRKEREDVIEF